MYSVVIAGYGWVIDSEGINSWRNTSAFKWTGAIACLEFIIHSPFPSPAERCKVCLRLNFILTELNAIWLCENGGHGVVKSTQCFIGVAPLPLGGDAPWVSVPGSPVGHMGGCVCAWRGSEAGGRSAAMDACRTLFSRPLLPAWEWGSGSSRELLTGGGSNRSRSWARHQEGRKQRGQNSREHLSDLSMIWLHSSQWRWKAPMCSTWQKN